jgi:hypothetical protein
MSLRHIWVWASIGCTCQMLGVEIELEVKTECDKKHGKVVHIAPLPMPGPPCCCMFMPPRPPRCCMFMPPGPPRCCMFMPPGLPGPPLLFLGVAVLIRSTVSDCGCACNRLVRYNLPLCRRRVLLARFEPVDVQQKRCQRGYTMPTGKNGTPANLIPCQSPTCNGARISGR